MERSQARLLSLSNGGTGAYRLSLARARYGSEADDEVSRRRLVHQPGLQGEIARDVRRTFPRHRLFQGNDGLGQRILFNVLSALASHSPSVGYCQGMNFVVAVMLCVAMDLEIKNDEDRELPNVSQEEQEKIESEVFWLMIAFLERFNMRELWRPGVPQLKLRIYQFDKIIFSKLPRVHAHFRSIGLSPDFFASQWFLTLMSYNIAMEQLVRVWDVLIYDGWKTIFRVGIAVLQRWAPRILKMSLEDLSTFFRHERDDGRNGPYVSDPRLLRSAFEVKISTKILEDMESEYVRHILLRRANKAPKVKSTNSGTFMDNDLFVDHRLAATVMKEIGNLDSKTKKDFTFFQSQIENADKIYRERDSAFQKAAREYIEIKTTLDELKNSKKAISNQLYELTKSPDNHDQDCVVLLGKIETIEGRIQALSEQFREALSRTSQAQVELEEIKEKKDAYSEQLRAVLEQRQEQASRILSQQSWEK